MRSIQTSLAFPLSSVKPLDGLLAYRDHCLAETENALKHSSRKRELSPISGSRLTPAGEIDGLAYGRCPESGSLFLMDLPDAQTWARLLAEVSGFRRTPKAFHPGLAQSRTDHIYAPRLEWMRDTLRLQSVSAGRVLEVVTAPSDFTILLRESGAFVEVCTVDEMELRMGGPDTAPEADSYDAAVLLESLDRVDDPAALLHRVVDRLSPGGVLFVTALVASGFDIAVLGLRNAYLYPPDRANCFSLRGLSTLLTQAGLTLLEVSTPGVLDVEIVQAHVRQDPSISLSPFERSIIEADEETHSVFQTFLQQQGLSSFARIVARKPS